MRFRRLKLSGFKSFVEAADLRIEPGLTGIVGPNGCGKSNLLEAIRWVMGEASAKSLRGGGMDDVIFAGTATRPARDFAEVSLLVERDPDEPGGEAQGGSEVTRRIERGAGSAYRIDGRDVRAKDVGLLFADAATGAHSPALVSQGRIGAVIAAKPAERRMMLEEAAGIAGLHARRKDAEQKLRATETNLERLDEILADQEARAGALRRQARAAERYRALTQRIRLTEAKLLYARWAEADRAAKAASDQAQVAEAEALRLQSAMRAADALRQASATALAERREAAAAAREAGSTLAHQLANARAGHDTAVRRLSELERLIVSLAADSAREQALRADAESALAALAAERRTLELRLAEGESTATRIAADLSAAEAVARGAEARLAQVLARQAAVRAERRVAEAAAEAAGNQARRVEAERDRLREQLAALGDGDSEQAVLDAAIEHGEQAGLELAEAEVALAAADGGRAAAAEARDSAESELAATRAVLSAARSESEALTRALAHGGGAALAQLTAAPGYERALAAALGEDIDAALGGEGPRRWEGSASEASDPPLATGLERLLDHVTAPRQLHRRLAQIGVAGADRGEKLLVGQRLVTRDGRLRRWDGMVSIGGGAAAAERLLRATRLNELGRLLPDLAIAAAEAQARRDQAAAAVDGQRQAAEAAREQAASAERQRREAARASDAASAALARLGDQRRQLDERLTDVAPLVAAARTSVAMADDALGALADSLTFEDDLVAARSAAAWSGNLVAEARAQAATRARETAAERERVATAGREASEWRTRLALTDERLTDAAMRAKALLAERAGLADEPNRRAAEIARTEQDFAAGETAISASAAAERDAQEAAAAAARGLHEIGEASGAAREARAGAAARSEAQAGRAQDFARLSVEQFDCSPVLLPERTGFTPDALDDPAAEKALLERLSGERERIGPVNLVAEQELAELDAGRAASTLERDELGQAIARLRGSIGSLNREGRVRLLEAFGQVDAHFRSLFSTLFDGGQAHLELVESDDPLEAGLEIMAQPPGKRLTSLTLLSGGEQALTAIALICALFLTNPAPICVLDEVDAPLDDANVERFCDLLDRMSGETATRYLIVTHNAVTMSRMHRLYGVTMIEPGVSRMVSVDLAIAEQYIAGL